MNTPDISYEYSTLMVGTLPGQRYEWYTDSNFLEVKRKVVEQIDKSDIDLGFFNVKSHPALLQELMIYNVAVMFVGLIFDVLLMIFVIVATLLVFSLLLISVESKTFENGVLRLVGLNKLGQTGMILT